MVHGGGGKLAAAATIAARYSCVRRQGFVSGEAGVSFRAPERKIIDYQVHARRAAPPPPLTTTTGPCVKRAARVAQMQSYRVFKGIATAYVLKLTGFALSDRLSKFVSTIAKGDVVPDDISELHATTAGLKGLCTWLAADGIEDLRKGWWAWRRPTFECH